MSDAPSDISERAPSKSSSKSSRVRPLTRTEYKREAGVEARIKSLRAVSHRHLRRIAVIEDQRIAAYIPEEALVYVIRECIREDRLRHAGDFAQILIRRCLDTMQRMLSKWRWRSLARREECLEDAIWSIWQCIFDTTEQSEFWEVRFWPCIERKMIASIRRHRLSDEMELSGETTLLEDAPTPDGVARFEHRAPMTLEINAEIRDALSTLSERERKVFVLYVVERWPQKDIATQLNITERGVRYLIQRAEERLAQWRDGE